MRVITAPDVSGAGPPRPCEVRAASWGEATRSGGGTGGEDRRSAVWVQCALFSLFRALARPLAHSWFTRARSFAFG